MTNSAGGQFTAATGLSSSYSVLTEAEVDRKVTGADGGYEFTGGFSERTTGQTGADSIGTSVAYTAQMVDDKSWYRFGFSPVQQALNDVEYWGETDPSFDQTKGLFGGLHMPAGVSNLFDFTDTSFAAASTTGDMKYNYAEGSIDLTQCRVGDLIKVRFSFNTIPQIANTSVEVGLVFATRDENDNVTFIFPLTTQPIFFGTGAVGETYLNRIEISAYVASDEDLNARALPAIRANNEIFVQPLSTLVSVVR